MIEHISKLPWWSRVWVLQESILPKGRVFAIDGESRADDIMLLEDAGSLIPRHYERGECCKTFWDNLPTWQQDVLRRFAKLMDASNFIRNIDSHLSAHPIDRLYDLVSRARHLGATDARDKIFGLLGVALHAGQEGITNEDQTILPSGQHDTSTDQQLSSSGDTGLTVSNTAVEAAAAIAANDTAIVKIDKRSEILGIVPDYRQTTVEVYAKFALRLILRQRNLGVLAVKENVPVGLEDLPSWVPKWSPSVDGSTDILTKERMNHFMACHSSSTELPRLIDSFALAVVGLRFDRIAATTRPLYESATGISGAVKEIEAFLGLDIDPYATYQDSIPLAHAAWRTMVGDLLYYVDKELKADIIKFARVQKPAIQMLRLARFIWDGNEATVYVTYAEEIVSLQDRRILDFAEMARKSFWYANEARLFFKTEHGYIGSAPADALVGDEIAIVDGSLLPLLLRRTEPVATLPMVKEGKLGDSNDSWFKFVGCPYVCGIMDGEAGYTQSEESIKALMERTGDVYSPELHLVAGKILSDGDLQRQWLFLA